MTYEEFRIISEKPLLSVEEASELTGLGQHTIRAIAADPSYDVALHVGSRTRIKRKALIQVLEETDTLDY